MGKKTKKTKWRTLEISTKGKYSDHFEDCEPAATTTTTTAATTTTFSSGRWEDGRRTSFSNSHHQHHHYQAHHHHHHNYEKASYRRQSSSSPAVSAANVVTSSSNAKYSSSKDESKTLIEDEYTKITTPRQDVLFKKGYLTRRKVVPETVSENSVDQTSDDIAQDCSNNEDFSNYTNSDDSVQQFVCPNPQSYIDPSALYYGGGSYEIFDPYTGNVTVVVGPPGNQYPSNNSCQPIMTSVRPVPLQPVQWFNPVPSSDWCCSYSPQDKRYSTDSQNGSGVGSESSGVPESPPEIVDETLANNGPVFPPSYVYPGYMFGAPIYNVDGVNVQYYAPPSPELSSTTEQTASKRRKKRKRRRRTGETEEESESSVDDNCNRSISSTECILDFPAQIALDYDAEALVNGRLVGAENSFAPDSNAGLLYSSLPHSVVDAPEFVPAEYSALCQPAPVDAIAAPSSSSQNSRDNSPPASNYVPKSASAGLNVYCKPFDGGRSAKHDSERVSSSNNSDSGISSPGSEDASKREFRPKEAKVGASAGSGSGGSGTSCAVGDSGSKFKKPKSRRSSKASSTTAKNKVEELTTAPKVRQGGQPNQRTAPKGTTPSSKPARRGDAKKECGSGGFVEESHASKKQESNASRVNRRVKNCAVISPTKTKELRKDAKEAGVDERKCDEQVVALEKLEPLETAPSASETDCAKPISGDADNHDDGAKDELVNERLAEEISRCDGCSSACAKSSGSAETCIRDIEDDCKVLVNCDTQLQPSSLAEALSVDAVSNSCTPATDIASTMLNEYVQIEEQPVLAKLIDLNDLADECADALDELSISEYASCRENSSHASAVTAQVAPTAHVAPTPPPRRRKPNRKYVESAAAELVDDVIARAQQRVLSSVTSSKTTACDNKFQLPVTQAVTKWLNEHGGLPAVCVDELLDAEERKMPNGCHSLDEDESSDEEVAQLQEKNVDNVKMAVTMMTTTTTKTKTQKKLKQNCVIC